MKSGYFIKLLLLHLLSVACGCEREITNPFDPECPKEIWTPTRFQATQDENGIHLTWKQENMNISGFKIDRKAGDLEWNQVASPGKTNTSWTDTDISGGGIYRYRLYAYAEKNQSNQVTTEITPLLRATVITSTPVNIVCSSTTLGGNISSDGGSTITERGVIYSIPPVPVTSGTKVVIGSGPGVFSKQVTGLPLNTTFLVKAYAINSSGISYGEEKSFITPTIATVTTATITNISASSAVVGGIVSSDGGAQVTERGVAYATTTNPTVSGNKIVIGSGTGTFSQTLTGLSCGTTYYARAYAVNCAGISYGSQISFPTANCQLVNLYFTGISATSPVPPGGVVRIRGTLNGTGLSSRAITPSIAIYASLNGMINVGDKPFYEVQAQLSLFDSSFNFEYETTAPSVITSFYLIFLADSKNEIEESDESDNRASVKITIGK